MFARMTAIAALAAAPAFAGDATVCRDFAAIAYSGAMDGTDMDSIPDGIVEMFTARDVSSEADARLVSAAYLAGYSQGLIFIDPAEAAAQFFSACVSEGV